MSDHLTLTQKDLEQDGFSKKPFFHVIVAEVPESHKSSGGHTKIGYALYYFGYNSRKGRTVHMDDLYVMPESRGMGPVSQRGRYKYHLSTETCVWCLSPCFGTKIIYLCVS
uniref:N-acetyltransferase domain-containing protein n=1 Tax=Salarias fasciatus TaxID=181472 RepID=A0A672J456_SALFA